MATDTIECPECGETIESEDHVDVQEVREIRSKPRGGIGYGVAPDNLFLCKNCTNPLGVGRLDRE